MGNLIEIWKLKQPTQFNSSWLHFGDYAPSKIIRENTFQQKKKKPGLKFKPGLVLIGLRTTGPRWGPSE